MGWWDFSRTVFEGLTSPPADTAACDRAVEHLARASRLGSALHRASWAIRRVWSDSLVGDLLSRVFSEPAPESFAAVMRVRGFVAAVAGATALLLNATRTASGGPLIWVLPSAVVAGGLLVVLAAEPLARAGIDRRRRHKIS